MYRVRWSFVVALACAMGVFVLLLRGCLYARAPADGITDGAASPQTGADLSVTVCDRRTGEIATLALEEYLVGVVAAEMPASFETEALRAQAVAARTYTVRKLLRGGCNSSAADICTGSNCCQAFATEERQRARWTTGYAENRARVEAAVRDTAGEILLYAGEPIEALYHSASGGYTEDSENVFAAAQPYLRAVESAGETGTSRLSGTLSLSYADLCETVNAAYPQAKLSEARLNDQIAVLSRTESGRVKKIRLGGAELTGKQLRYLLGLDSTLFTVTLTGRTARFDTRGFGHGVGMSQTGANAMAQAGQGYREILQHYYTSVTVADWRTLAALQGGQAAGGTESP